MDANKKAYRAWSLLMIESGFPQGCIDRDCKYLREIPDIYGTGDSPTGYNCDANKYVECPFYENIAKTVESW
jgi:hypothetical protein